MVVGQPCPRDRKGDVMEEFENGLMVLANPQTLRGGGVVHWIHQDPTEGPVPLCRPGYKNKTNQAKGHPGPVTCRLCMKIKARP
jgi:hypothetical protein